MAQPQLPSTLKEGFTGMPEVFRPERAAGANATIQFKFTGAEPGNYSSRSPMASATDGGPPTAPPSPSTPRPTCG